MTIRLLIWIVGMLYCFYSIRLDFGIAQVEVCDNALDDDGDGLIDLNDPDCDCNVSQVVSLFPNFSFEDTLCCPSNRDQVNCTKSWVRASDVPVDYLHSCGWFGWDHLPPPQPLPDGDAVIGIRNGRYTSGSVNPNFKSYLGICLPSPLRAGNTYKFKLNVGFLNVKISPPMDIVLYGTTNCQNLPFGAGNANFGCPTNHPNWKVLKSKRINGLNEWIEAEFTFTPTENIAAVAIGSDCLSLTGSIADLNDIYYFLDNLILTDSLALEFDITASGHPCSGNFTLQIPSNNTSQYQWYKDGIALIGETKPELQVKTGEGDYVARIIGPSFCKTTKPLEHRIPTFSTEINEVICNGGSYQFNNQTLTKEGIYQATFKTAQGCDSLVLLNLNVAGEQLYDTIVAKVFAGEFYNIGGFRYSKSGRYDVILPSTNGCDSLVHLILEVFQVYIPNAFSPNGDGVNDRFTIFVGDDQTQVKNLQIFNRWGDLVFQKQDFSLDKAAIGWDGQFKNQPAESGVYVYLAELTTDNGVVISFSGSVTLIR
ncbi:MAG: gliding motility-associated C-terminal domain-containing protein [Saprospiraceae bacterium]|nr:gliding motility-associated C-terminal domain-containing protein [Saprospiraceae bacterium]